MHAETGHLVSPERMREIERELSGGQNEYIQVPEELNRAARRKLNGKSEAYVSLTSGGKLSSWAAKQRKNKRQMAKKARRRNR